MAWYQQDNHEIFSRLNTSEHGLSDAQAAELLQRHGLNLIAEPERISKIRLFLHQFASPLIYILILAAIITIYLQEYKDSGVIIVVVLFN
ncbi:MAG: cation-transporting P-type ATPase, partial [Syntrophobacterales bacterium]